MSGAQAFLARIVTALDQAQVPYMLAGSFASSHHGAPRATQDIDIIVDPNQDSLKEFLRLISSATTYVDPDTALDEFKRRGQFNVIDIETAWKLDVIFRKPRRFSRIELSRRAPATILGLSVQVASLEDTILTKLEWAKLGSSERQLRDVSTLVEVTGDAIDIEYLEQWLDELGVRDLWERIKQ
ncbi:MAG: nucleotidyl transferase AbiEii/AbiGii toxin family protein [Myxococcales bacterium]|nr:nucleotidyl transferase AbiEii/AbiGii toxin family protein [Myxococcales bacterium]